MAPGAGVEKGLTAKGTATRPGVAETFCVITVVVVIRLYTFVKTHRIRHLKLMGFILCKLYFNKAEQKIKLFNLHTNTQIIILHKRGNKHYYPHLKDEKSKPREVK